MDHGNQELHRKYRPTTLKQVVGQDEAVRQLVGYDKSGWPHAIMFTGHTGCGKSTLANIVRGRLGCADEDFVRVDCATVEEPLKAVREITQTVPLGPMAGKSRVWLLEEVQALSRAPFAQQGLLVCLENTPRHAYFMLCTTDPGKVLPALRNRCAQVALRQVDKPSLSQAVAVALAGEKRTLSPLVLEALLEQAGGCVREALQLLGRVLNVTTEKDQLAALKQGDELKADAFELVRLLLWDKTVTWKKLLACLERVDTTNVEGFRHLVLTCARKELRKPDGNHARAHAVATAFRFPMWDAPEVGIECACWEVFQGR
jgi:DNA polymerase III gamma/tau subunit